MTAFIPITLSAVLLTAAVCAQVPATRTLTQAREVRTLTVEGAQTGLPVRMQGVVGFIEAPGTVFFQDETGGTFFRTKERLGQMRVGDVVQVEGVTVPGLYLTGIEASSFRVVGHGLPPVAEKASFDDLATGRFHYQRVEVEGIGRRLTALDENRSLLFVAMGSRVIEVRVDAPPSTAGELIDAKLRITALAAGGINDRRQLVFPYLRVTAWEAVEVTTPAPNLDTLPGTRAANLLRFVAGGDQASGHRVRVAGVVLASFADGQVFVRDVAPVADISVAPNSPARPMGNALGIRFSNPVAVRQGEVIEAAGFPGMEGFSAGLADAVLLVPTKPVETAVTADPVVVSAKDLLAGAHDGDLVTLPAALKDFYRTSNGIELRLSADGVPVRAMMPGAAAGAQVPAFGLAAGMRVQVVGICRVEASTDKGFRSQPQRAALLLRGPSDLQLLQAPSWWTTQRLVWAVTALGLVIALGLLWITVLRRRIVRQASALRQRIAREAVLEERQRIAREFHDTLEQELAGLSLRLDAATTRPLEDKARGLLQASLHLVACIQIEARNLVADLRAEGEEATDLALSLENLVGRQVRDGGPEVQLIIDGVLPKLPAHVVHHLRMIAQEALTNVLKHAQAEKVVIQGRFLEGDLWELSICDNGQGMEAGQTHGKPGHFGCMGIRERCRKVGAEVEWKTGANGGTCVVVRYAGQLAV